MLDNLGYPPSCFVLERGLSQMPHLATSSQKFPNRRFDIICFAKGIHPDHDLYPLILIECKAVKLTDSVIRQVVGYNVYLKACYVAIANADEVQTGWYDSSKKRYQFLPGLPSYEDCTKCFGVRR